ncbi:unnamed protein product [Anisakis simplex]|uniref:Transmembrane protein n=1 Tax=Anisakis simplex TaxID=6269 RepID=A0A0M3K161_ANISI|nr:unnamed protein product [Anisakis simplex]
MSATPQVSSSFFNKFDPSKPCQKCATANEFIARQIDKYSRSVFPTVFLIFSVSYWLYYVWFTREED